MRRGAPGQLPHQRTMELREAIREGMARALWVMAYANWADENPDEDVARAGAGEDWVDIAPETPDGAEKAAADLEELFASANRKMNLATAMPGLLSAAVEAIGPANADRAETKLASEFGFDMAMQALGTGVSWFDNYPTFDIEIPDFECHFDGDELVWSGASPRTPSGPVRKAGHGKGRRNPGKRWFYVFYYESGRTKEYWGPFADRKEAVAIRDKERAKYPALKAGYKLESLTDAEFERVWGVPPKNNPELPHNWPSSEVQSLLFPKDQYTVEGAKKWAEEHGYAYGKVDSHGSYHRLRQHAPEGGPCRTIEFGAGIKAVVCSKGAGKPPGVPNPETFEGDLEHWDD